MRIDSSLPLHVARLYQSQRPHAAATRFAHSATAPQGPQATQRPGQVDRLIAGRVAQPADFAGASIPAASVNALQMYTRAADRVEAAVGVELGRRIDVAG